jgi:hypothetical protein
MLSSEATIRPACSTSAVFPRKIPQHDPGPYDRDRARPALDGTRSPEEIAKLMPEEYAMGNHDLYAAIIAKSEAMFSPEGRLSHEGAQNTLKVLSAFDPAVAGAKIDLKAGYTKRLAEKASALH